MYNPILDDILVFDAVLFSCSDLFFFSASTLLTEPRHAAGLRWKLSEACKVWQEKTLLSLDQLGQHRGVVASSTARKSFREPPWENPQEGHREGHGYVLEIMAYYLSHRGLSFICLLLKLSGCFEWYLSIYIFLKKVVCSFGFESFFACLLCFPIGLCIKAEKKCQLIGKLQAVSVHTRVSFVIYFYEKHKKHNQQCKIFEYF